MDKHDYKPEEGRIGDDVSVTKQFIRRELDSLDDFEHLSHDSSPLTEHRENIVGVGDLLGDFNTEPLARDVHGLINTRGEGKSATAVHKFTDDDFSPFDPLSNKTSGQSDFGVGGKTDTNLYEMGDTMPEPLNPDDQLEKFSELESFVSSKHNKESPDDNATKSPSQNFIDNERELVQNKNSSSGFVDHYLDTEPDANENDFFKLSKSDDSPNKKSESKFVDNSKEGSGSAFKDFDDFEPEPLKKSLPPASMSDYHKADFDTTAFDPIPSAKPSKPSPEESRHEKSKVDLKPETKLPEPVKEIIGDIKKAVIPKREPKIDAMEAEVLFRKMGLDAWFNPERLDPRVESLIYWRDPKKSGAVFGSVLVVLLALTYFSLISVVAYLSLLVLTATISLRIYRNVIQAVQKTSDGHPFKDILDQDLTLPQDKVKEITEVAVAHINAGITELRRLFLVEDLVDSIKFGVLLWTLTYLGAWFNGMTLIILAWVALFSLPKVYETNKTQIDANLDIVRTKIAELTTKVKGILGKKPEEKKEQ